ncbi:MAG: glycoside hydrolase family 9 protein [bacterium]|nr:MAG: glycoside hydrolase family 9 protein [bacterium]
MNLRVFVMIRLVFALIICLVSQVFSQQNLAINDKGYFEIPGLNVMVFSDIYPEGHQTGVTIIQHGVRVAANGDLRLEPCPGQWSPVPKAGKLTVDKENQNITQRLWYPDSSRNRTGFNPIEYPDLKFQYEITVTALEGNSIKITVDLDEPLPEEWIGRVGFNFELFPGYLFGKSFLMDDQTGYFPMQPTGPVQDYYGEYLAQPLAKGKRLVVAPEEDKQHLLIETNTEMLELRDGRSNHNNGWFIVRSIISANATKAAVEWIVTPNVIPNWLYEPVIQVSQLGYHPEQTKRVVIEQDQRDDKASDISIYRLTAHGKEKVKIGTPTHWGKFLRYNYLTYNFSDIKELGMYIIEYRSKTSHPFQISQQVYSHVWQPTLEYFLPVQMCHVRVNEKYRVWHGACHLDDALMAPININHFDSYVQGQSTLTNYAPQQHVPQLNQGGWHDAGDYDLRVESQIGTVWMLALMIEEFGLDYDATFIDQENRIVEIHLPDGKSDVIQQIEHGLLSVLGGYRALGRLYRGIICSDLRQYILLGDGANMTDNVIYDSRKSKMDDRRVFTEDNPDRALYVAVGLAAASRALRFTNPTLSKECLETALALWNSEKDKVKRSGFKVVALSELILATGDETLKRIFVSMKDEIVKGIRWHAWAVGHVFHQIADEKFKRDVSTAVAKYMEALQNESKINSPYGVPYRPNIWGAGWNIQRFGVEQYFIYKAWPEYGSKDLVLDALNFILGVHPGENTASFVSGVGSQSTLVAYGVNRADWSFIPGGVASGTALIRPDLPELKIWPYLWQQTEYVIGGGATNFMFLVLAAQKLFDKQ